MITNYDIRIVEILQAKLNQENNLKEWFEITSGIMSETFGATFPPISELEKIKEENSKEKAKQYMSDLITHLQKLQAEEIEQLKNPLPPPKKKAWTINGFFNLAFLKIASLFLD